ncbi:GNAT family N-acetyltransferase [Roseibacterium beibuensis]|uniref:N-acetyltransferase domain-containing protein n=1 Tax=[Roseibacterium] beibuensis TaxID=1193142 RepID=A0ABP9LSU0_9RHOB|nr:GNAT family N-acetyltransferase [Roseibacterium beibuensis]MCS6627814.1 GNAT family N-acetyltransferase [Roseibacterium beibuensis]
MIVARPLRTTEVEAAHALRLKGISEFPFAFLLTMDEARQTGVDQLRRQAATGSLIGLFDGESLIGMAGLNSPTLDRIRHRAEIGPFYVEPDHHGTGAAELLMRSVVETARGQGTLLLELNVWEDNARAVQFYRTHGFRTVGRIPAAVRGGSGWETDLHMVLDLAPKPQNARLHADAAVRKLGPEDWAVFRDIRLDMLAESPTVYGSRLEDWAAKTEADIRQWLGDLRAFAVMDGARCLSVAAWHAHPGVVQQHRGHVISAYTRPEARGAGMFRAVMAAIEADARAHGIRQMELDVADGNDAAKAYAALGYSEVGRIPDAMNHDGKMSDSLIFIRRLA